ncbi:MAG TPA: DUF1311 domain-containing protein [Flavobacteriia bacterium]|nr:DUF1311 domain-containing protein [Flavobacteriia bacterium]
MKYYLLLIVFFGIKSFSQSKTTAEKDIFTMYNKTQVELKTVYQKIQTEYKADTLFIKKLQKAQQSWHTYKDAELEARFPEKDKTSTYGSQYKVCKTLFLTELMQGRIKRLRVWLNGIEEGDTCSGSVKFK